MIPSDVDVPYAPQPFAEAHPERLAVLARLRGMTPAPTARCRVLEIGCGSGGHLLPIAARYPEGRFVGIDLDPKEIATARDLAERLDLRNVRFEAMDLRDARKVLAARGPFDFVVAHGMYSWVPADAREALVALFGDVLAEQGVAYLSHNALPGFLLREFLRDMLKVHVANESSARRAAEKAREFASVLLSSPVAGPRAPEMLRRAIEGLRRASDVRLTYDDLAANEAFFFGDVVAHAERHGLSYLCDAVPGADMENVFGGLGGQALKELASDRLQYQEYLDFFMVRHFRRTLLCRKTAELLSRPDPTVIRDLFVASQFGTVPPAIQAFGDAPLTRVVLSILGERWPAAPSVAELRRATANEGATRNPPHAAAEDDALERTLLALYERGIVELLTNPSPAVRRPGERPRAWDVARLSAELGRPIPNLHHAPVELRHEQRALLALLDGSRTREELHGVAASVAKDAPPALVDRLLEELGDHALLIE